MTSDYADLGATIGQLVTEKQAAYGDSFGKAGDVLRILYPNGISPDQLVDALAVARIVDKLFRLATKPDAFGESPYNDIAGYALLGAARAVKRDPRQPGVGERRWRCVECGHVAIVSRIQQLPECCDAPAYEVCT